MGLFNDMSKTVKNIFSADDDGIFEGDEKDFEEPSQELPLPKFLFGTNKKKNEDENKSMNNTLPPFDVTNHDFNIVKTSRQQTPRKSNGKIQIYVPKTFEEGFAIIKDVKSGMTAMVNVEIANPQVAQRVIDLISGAIFALDGECKKVGEKQYLFSLSVETVGAYDYLPVNGGMLDNQNNGMQQFNFNMSNPFNFGETNNSMQFMPNQNFGQQGQYVNMQQPQQGQSNFMNQQPVPQPPQNNFPQPQQQNVDLSSFYVPPKSQF